jgi:hypothetical protein
MPERHVLVSKGNLPTCSCGALPTFTPVFDWHAAHVEHERMTPAPTTRVAPEVRAAIAAQRTEET